MHFGFRDDDEESPTLVVEIIDLGPVMTREEQMIIKKPLDSTRQAPLDKCNISDVRLIVKAVNADLEISTVEQDEQTSCTCFTLILPVIIV